MPDRGGKSGTVSLLIVQACIWMTALNKTLLKKRYVKTKTRDIAIKQRRKGRVERKGPM